MDLKIRVLKPRLTSRLTYIAVFIPALMIAAVLMLVYFRILAVTPPTTEYPVRGIDVSHHNGEINWDSVALQNIKFAYIKASEGNDLQDRRFEQNWKEIRRVGLIPGAFHVFGNCSKGVEQAQNFLMVWIDRRVTLQPAVDVSSGAACARANGKPEDELIAFLDEIERSIGRRPIVYDNRVEIPAIGRPSRNPDTKWARGIILHPNSSHRDNWIFWQYSHRGKVDGIIGPVDLNVFQGSEEEFEEFVNPRH